MGKGWGDYNGQMADAPASAIAATERKTRIETKMTAK
jgi:hypothetical protein